MGAASEVEDARVRRQDAGKKPADEHASSQSVAARTVTDEQLFLMDTRGYVVLPAVLSPAECDEIKAHLYGGGSSWEGPAQRLLDHPALVAVLNEFLVERDLGEDFYNFRCEVRFQPGIPRVTAQRFSMALSQGVLGFQSSFATIRAAGFKAGGTDVAHTVRPPQRANAMRYHAAGGRVHTVRAAPGRLSALRIFL
jgi:hypothetical protein